MTILPDTIIYTRKPLSWKLLWQAPLFILLGLWLFDLGWTKSHMADAYSQIRGTKEIIAAALVFICSFLSVLFCGLTIFRDAPMLTISGQSIIYKGIFQTYSAKWTSLEPFEIIGKSFLTAKIIGADVTPNIKRKKEFGIQLQLDVDAIDLCNELNRRIAFAQGVDFIPQPKISLGNIQK